MPVEGSAIEVTSLTKRFGQVLAVDHISFEVKKAELFGFLGPNGAGKTTTIRMLTGIIKKDEGEAWVMGYPAGSLPAKQVSGVVPEQANAYMDLSGWGNLMLMAELYRTPSSEAKKRATALLEQLGLLERKDSKVMTYSMGMRKRLILAMALLSNPQILFLDEPTSGLDVQSTRFIRGMLRNLRNEGKTIMLTTHNMEEAAELSDRLAIINRGKLVALDTPDNLRITGGRVYLVDVAFDKPVPIETMLNIPGVNRVEQAQAIAEAEKMRVQAAMMPARPGMGPGGGGMGGMRRQGIGGPPAGGGPQAQCSGPGSTNKDDYNRVRLYTEDTTKLVTSLVDFSRTNSLQMKILDVRSPSLEDAFIRLTEKAKRG